MLKRPSNLHFSKGQFHLLFIYTNEKSQYFHVSPVCGRAFSHTLNDGNAVNASQSKHLPVIHTEVHFRFLLFTMNYWCLYHAEINFMKVERKSLNLHQWQTFNSLIPFLSSGSDDLDPDLARLGSLGFTGCLSVVRFNSISPLKAALLHPDTSPVVITGPLVQSNCGSPASANPYAAENTHHLSGRRGKAFQFNWN